MAAKLERLKAGTFLVKGTVLHYRWFHKTLDAEVEALILVTRDSRVGVKGYANALCLWSENPDWGFKTPKSSMRWDAGDARIVGDITLKSP